MVLFLFVVMLMNTGAAEERGLDVPHRWDVALLFAPRLSRCPFLYVHWTERFPDLPQNPDAIRTVRGPHRGQLRGGRMALYRDYLVPFEVASLFLLVAMIGAIVIGKRARREKRGLIERVDRIRVHDRGASSALLLSLRGRPVGVIVRRNMITVLMCIELMLNAVNINLVAFSHRLSDLTGQVFTIFVITIAAGEAAVGLAIIIRCTGSSKTLNVEEARTLQG